MFVSLNEFHSFIYPEPCIPEKPFGRNQPRKQAHIAPKAENGVEESFEDLLIKYKQIQLELECIRQQAEEASSVTASPDAEVETETTDVEKETSTPEQPPESEQQLEPEKEEKKAFQAFNIKPLRQKLLTPAERDALNAKLSKEQEKTEVEPSTEEQTTTTVKGKYIYTRSLCLIVACLYMFGLLCSVLLGSPKRLFDTFKIWLKIF